MSCTRMTYAQGNFRISILELQNKCLAAIVNEEEDLGLLNTGREELSLKQQNASKPRRLSSGFSLPYVETQAENRPYRYRSEGSSSTSASISHSKFRSG